MKKLFLIFSATMFLLAGCGNSEKRYHKNVEADPVIGEIKIIRTKPMDEPKWTTSLYKASKEFPEYELFIGISPYSGNERDALKLAEQDAIGKVVTYLGTTGEKNLKKVLSNAGVDFVNIGEAARERISIVSKNFADGIKTIETYTEFGERYSSKQIWERYVKVTVLYGLEQQDFSNARKRIKAVQKEILSKEANKLTNKDKRALLDKAIEELDRETKE